MIKLGRMPECEIKIEDNLLSKYQASIKFVAGSGWTLYDGYNGKVSTNGNWYLT
jgi:FHA domain